MARKEPLGVTLTWAAMTRCRSAIKVHLAQRQSRQRQYRLWPLSALTWSSRKGYETNNKERRERISGRLKKTSMRSVIYSKMMLLLRVKTATVNKTATGWSGGVVKRALAVSEGARVTPRNRKFGGQQVSNKQLSTRATV